MTRAANLAIFASSPPTSNSSLITVGANVSVNATTIFVGNASINSTHTSSLFQVSNSTSTANLTASSLTIGSTVVSNSAVTVAGDLVPSTSFMRNKIINGNMVINQRGYTNISPLSSTGYCCDRFKVGQGTAGSWSAYPSYSNPPANSGHPAALVFSSLRTGSISSGDANYIYQGIEGYNIVDLQWGSSSAKPVTLSFWFYSGATGTYSGSLVNGAGTLSYPFTFSIPSSTTWTQISVTIPGPTSGTWYNDNSAGINVYFDLGSGSTLRTTAGSWTSGNYVGVTGATQYPTNTLTGTIQITGVQLEAGSSATPYERRPYGQELALCQRYYAAWAGTANSTGYPCIGVGSVVSSTQALCHIPLPVTPRLTPTLGFTGTVNMYNGSAYPLTSISTTYTTSPSSVMALFTASSATFSTGQCITCYLANSSLNAFSSYSELA